MGTVGLKTSSKGLAAVVTAAQHGPSVSSANYHGGYGGGSAGTLGRAKIVRGQYPGITPKPLQNIQPSTPPGAIRGRRERIRSNSKVNSIWDTLPAKLSDAPPKCGHESQKNRPAASETVPQSSTLIGAKTARCCRLSAWRRSSYTGQGTPAAKSHAANAPRLGLLACARWASPSWASGRTAVMPLTSTL
jgi:hypothetical protein